MLTTMNVSDAHVCFRLEVYSPAILSSFSQINAIHTFTMSHVDVPIISITLSNETADVFRAKNSEII